MCAIAGLVGLPLSEDGRKAMEETMVRRGPDGSGVVTRENCTLLHHRLAVIDLQGGKQPMELAWNGEEYIITYNGELYNTEALRHDLLRAGHRFEGHSDTEVLLHSYAQWGEDCLERLNGIFAFGVWETRAKRLFLARDRIGVKPLFFSRQGSGLLFASEIKTILAYPGMKAQLDAQGIAEVLLMGPGRTPGCGVFRGIEELEPGCCGYFDAGKLRQRRYWWLRDREHHQDFGETAEQVRWLVTDAISRQMVSDVPIGTFLSGGLDSSLISSVCARATKERGQRLQTYSVDYVDNEKYFKPGKFQPNSDSHYIRVMAQALESDHHLVLLTPQDLVNVLEEATIARDLPGMADVDFSLLAFCRRIRETATVALSGECADEIFGGYPWYRDPEIRSREGFPWAQTTRQRISFLQPWIRDRLNPEEYIRQRYADCCKSSDILPGNSPQEKRMKEMVNLNFRYFMQTLLDRKDRMSMYSALEVRVPFCDYRIAEYLYGVPWSFKDHHGVEKGLLRQAMQGLLPAEVLWRKKSPYPKTFDPMYFQIVSEKLKKLLVTKDAPIYQIVRREALENLLTAEFAWPWYGQLMNIPQTIAYMLQIDFWLRHYKIEIAA